VNSIIHTVFLASQSFAFWSVVALGACIGSFMNVCIIRIPEQTFFKQLRSVCPACGAQIPVYLNVPIFGFFILHGRAKCCGAKLSWQYPIIELAGAIIFAGMYFKFPFLGWSLETPVFELNAFLRWIHAVTFISLMLIMSVIDAKLMIIPDVLSIGMILLSPVVVALHPDLDFRSSAVGLIAGGGVLYVIAWAYWLIRREYGLGFGDVKLLAAIGGWLGWQSVFPTLFLGSFVGSILAITVMLIARKFSWQMRIPFGPYLASGAVVYLLWGHEIFLWLAPAG
jgi:leader peptidase (prepilin peptidase)/N-methyltransferase